MRRIQDAYRTFQHHHERVKRYVHTAWRVPLPKWGQNVMGCIYFSIPVVGGWHVMQWAIGKSHDSIGPKGEKLRIKEVEGIGDQTTIEGETKKVGAGGIGMGVRLAVSDKDDQQRSKKMLNKVLKEARKRHDEQQKMKKRHD